MHVLDKCDAWFLSSFTGLIRSNRILSDDEKSREGSSKVYCNNKRKQETITQRAILTIDLVSLLTLLSTVYLVQRQGHRRGTPY